MLQRIALAWSLAIVLPVLIYGGVDGAKWLVAAALMVTLHEFGPVASPERPKSAFVAMALVGGTIYGMISWGRDPMLVRARWWSESVSCSLGRCLLTKTQRKGPSPVP